MNKPEVVLADRYELRGLLGTGGMGRVFLGRDRVLERDVAVKVLAPHLAEDEPAVRRFGAEARAAAGLNHPAVVSVFDSGSQGDIHYLVMEHVEGTTVGGLLRARGALPPAEAASVAERVATALEVAHQAGIVHRDVKPGNVMVTADGFVKIMDFGIARALSSDTATHTAAILGTVSYLSPEQAKGEAAEPRSDLYALGVVLYEMLTGAAPFVADTPLAVAYKHLEEEPPPPSSRNPGVPAELDAIVLRAMAKRPDARYPSAGAFADDLRAVLDGEPVMIPAPPGASDPGEDTGELVASIDQTSAGPRRVLLVVAAIVLAALIPLGVGLATWIGDTEPAPATPGEGKGGANKQEKQEKQEKQVETPGATPTPTASRSPKSPKESPDAEREPATRQGSDSSDEKEAGTEEDEEEAEPTPSPSASASPSPSPSVSPSPEANLGTG